MDVFILVLLPIETELFSRETSLYITLTGVFLTGLLRFCNYFSDISGCVTAILFGSVVGLAALFPPKYTGAVMSGNGIAGLASAALRILTKISVPATNEGNFSGIV